MVPSPWLPSWLGLAWAAVFVVILVVHLWHIVVMTGRDRRWHSVHVLMALGMVVMFVPTGEMIVPYRVGMAFFAATAVAVAGLLGWERVHRHHIGRLWTVAVVDLAAMVYMFAMISTRVVWLTIPLAVWLVLQAAGWVSGRLWAVLETGGLGGIRLVQTRVLATTVLATTVLPTTVLPTTGVAAGLQAGQEHPRQGHPRQGHQSLAVPATSAYNHSHGARVAISTTLTLMALGMAYMLIAMQFGMHPMPGMPMASP